MSWFTGEAVQNEFEDIEVDDDEDDDDDDEDEDDDEEEEEDEDEEQDGKNRKKVLLIDQMSLVVFGTLLSHNFLYLEYWYGITKV